MTEGRFTFDQQRVLIFGGGKGIGRAIAQVFARRGAQLAIADIDLESAQECARLISGEGRAASAVSCDATRLASVADAVNTDREASGDIDGAVNNVGAIVSGHPEDIPLDEWQRILNLNLMSVLNSTQFLLPKMLQRGSGFIVNTASFAGLFPYAADRGPYVASKAAVVALTESLALYLQPLGFRVYCFCPGPVITGIRDTMKIWTEDAQMVGPGSQFALLTVEQAAEVLAAGMEAERIFIPTHEAVIDEMVARASDPDAYIRRRVDALSQGELGLPAISKPATPAPGSS